jgi:hypothetical protein
LALNRTGNRVLSPGEGQELIVENRPIRNMVP